MLLQITSMALTVAIMPDIITPDARSAVPFADNRRHESFQPTRPSSVAGPWI